MEKGETPSAFSDVKVSGSRKQEAHVLQEEGEFNEGGNESVCKTQEGHLEKVKASNEAMGDDCFKPGFLSSVSSSFVLIKKVRPKKSIWSYPGHLSHNTKRLYDQQEQETPGVTAKLPVCKNTGDSLSTGKKDLNRDGQKVSRPDQGGQESKTDEQKNTKKKFLVRDTEGRVMEPTISRLEISSSVSHGPQGKNISDNLYSAGGFGAPSKLQSARRSLFQAAANKDVDLSRQQSQEEMDYVLCGPRFYSEPSGTQTQRQMRGTEILTDSPHENVGDRLAVKQTWLPSAAWRNLTGSFVPVKSHPKQLFDLSQRRKRKSDPDTCSWSQRKPAQTGNDLKTSTDPKPEGDLDPGFSFSGFSTYDSKPSDNIPACSLSRAPTADLPGPLDQPSDLQDPSVTERHRAKADLSSVRSEAESGGGADAVVELDSASTAVSCSLTNTLQTHAQIQTCSSGPSWTKGVSGSLPRSHSSPSLSPMTSAERDPLTRAQSSPDLQFNSSCEHFTPHITADEDHKDHETYRFQCSGPGLYQCSVTGLVFHMEREGDVVYRTVPWNRKLLSQNHKQPAGPLFDIKCEQQSVCQLHLPHCEILSTGGADFLSVAHFDEEVIEFIDPHKITETHVIINITGLSAFGIVRDENSPPVPVKALVLVFYKPPADPDPTSLLNVMLLPRNVAFRNILLYRKKLDGDERYIETSPHCKLHPQQEYILSTCPQDDSVLVEPTTAEFDSDNYDNYFPSFQVTLEKTMTHLRLILRDTNSSLSVWERRVCLSGVQRSCGQKTQNLAPDKRLFEIRSSFIERVSGPVLKSLLDNLLDKTVMTNGEVESVNEKRNRRDKASFVIDTVRKKGEAASSEMIEALCDLDPFFSEHLGLM